MRRTVLWRRAQTSDLAPGSEVWLGKFLVSGPGDFRRTFGKARSGLARDGRLTHIDHETIIATQDTRAA